MITMDDIYIEALTLLSGRSAHSTASWLIRVNIIINHDGYTSKLLPDKANRNHKPVSRELSKKPLSVKFKFYMHRARIQKCTSLNCRNIFLALQFLKFISNPTINMAYSIELIISILVFSIRYRNYDFICDLQRIITPQIMTLDILYMLSIARIDRKDSLQDILYFLNEHRATATNHPLSYLQLELKKIDNLILFCASNIKTTQGVINMFTINNEWEKLPTKEEYLKKNNLSLFKCIYCDSTTVLDIGLSNMIDHRRKIICAKCKAILYREND